MLVSSLINENFTNSIVLFAKCNTNYNINWRSKTNCRWCNKYYMLSCLIWKKWTLAIKQWEPKICMMLEFWSKFFRMNRNWSQIIDQFFPCAWVIKWTHVIEQHCENCQILLYHKIISNSALWVPSAPQYPCSKFKKIL